MPSDVDLPEEALGAVARGELPVVMRADAEDDIRGAVRFAGEHGLKLIIAGGLEAWRCADLLKEKGVPVLLQVDRLPLRESDRYDASYTNPSALHRAGVRFAIVSDDAADSRNLPYEAAMARAYGLPAEVALRAITLAPGGDLRGRGPAWGRSAVGKDADVFVATGDIMDTRTQVTHVFVDGAPPVAGDAAHAPVPRVQGPALALGDALQAAHVGAQGLRDHHRAVRLLVVLEDRDQRAAHREAGAVQRVQEARLALRLRPVAQVRRAAPGSRCSSSRTRSRGTRSARAARPRGRRSWRS